MKRMIAAVLLMLVFVLHGCNTIKGVGRDIERTGEEIDERI